MPSFAPNIQRQVLPYILPHYLAIPFIVLGYGYQKSVNASFAPLFWLSTILGLEAYAMFSDPVKTEALWLRTPNFLYPPMAVLLAAGLYRLANTGGNSILRRLSKLTAAVTLSAIILLNVYSLYAAVGLQDRYLGYHWLYREEEYIAGSWLRSHSSPIKVAGDMKARYLIQDYFNLETNVAQGYQYLSGKNS